MITLYHRTEDSRPTRSHEYDAGYDLKAHVPNRVVINPGETVIIPTGVHAHVPGDEVALICSRSGLSTKGVFVANSPGVIDPGFTGELKVILHNGGRSTHVVARGDRVAQVVGVSTSVGTATKSVDDPEFETINDSYYEFGNVEGVRGSAGLGSTGINGEVKNNV